MNALFICFGFVVEGKPDLNCLQSPFLSLQTDGTAQPFTHNQFQSRPNSKKTLYY